MAPPGFAFPRGAELPSGLQFPMRTDVWTPLVFDKQELTERGTLNIAAVGRLRSGATIDAANAQLNALAQRLATRGAGSIERRGLRCGHIGDDWRSYRARADERLKARPRQRQRYRRVAPGDVVRTLLPHDRDEDGMSRSAGR